MRFALHEELTCQDPCTSPSSDSVEATLAQRLAGGQLQSIGFDPSEVIDSTGRSVSAPGSAAQIGLIVGCIIGGLILIALIVLVVVLCVRRNRNKGGYSTAPAYVPLASESTPYSSRVVSTPTPIAPSMLRAVALYSSPADLSQSLVGLVAGSSVSIEPKDWNPSNEWTWVESNGQQGYVPTSFLRLAK